ncbi:restriction endonuclease subunit S [Lacticaseibacillus paracasei]|uniref:restriction endonuclease subunit S n=1 Tax=Lacticaseibacillus paracasei TaxID=1597 RepID=UPI0021A8A8F2|nr:restriction endonuclease subunit S [Lacticaseibacillus paracasei]MCT3379266.1 restriction endonuclease subunit S [Lacticaseibacillus paracasei]
MFLEFAWNAWEKRKLGEVATITMGQSPDSKNYTLNPQDHILVQGNADIKNGWVEPRVWTTQITKIAKKGSVLLSVRAPVGEVSKTAFDVVLGRGVASVGQTDFLYQYLITLKINGFWLRYSTGSTFDSINSADIKDAIIFLPEKNEQSRIAKTLNCIDNLIAATQDKIDAFEQIKKAFLQHLFDQSWRFGEYSELWTSHLLGEITSKVTEKNTENLYHETFTNSAKYGIVEQQSFFDKLISNEANLTNYYVVRENDFVYNPRISNLAPVGPVRRNKLNRTGVMSPLYYVFKATNAAYPMFLEYFFKGESWYRFMYLNGDTGARSDRFAIKDKVFEQMPVKLPEESEQKKIGALLQNLETVMNQTQERLQKIRTIKDSLLKSLFV